MDDSIREAAVSINELNKWCGISYLDQQYKANIRLAYIFNDVTALVTTDDEFYLVGRNEHGSLGTGSENIYITKVPTRIDCLCRKRVINFAFGAQKKELKGKKNLLLSLFALTEDGCVFGWGNNEYGNLGLRYTSTHPVCPARVVFLREVFVTQLSCGAGHSLALSNSGEVWAWGRNFHGQVGNCNRQDHPFPVQIKAGEEGTKFSAVACGRSHSVALTTDGRVFTWGQDDQGQLGQDLKGSEGFNYTPTQIQFPGNVGPVTIIKIICGKRHTLALSQEGDVFAWGSNAHSELGSDDEMEQSSIPILVKVGDSDRILEIAAVPHLSVSVCRSSNKVYMWGKLPEQSGMSVAPWETFMNSIPDVFSSFVVPALVHRPISIASMHHYANVGIHPDLVMWSGLKFIHPRFLQDLKLAFVCGIGFEQTTILVSMNDDVLFVGKNIHGSLGTGVTPGFETRLPIKNNRLSGKDICNITFGLDVAGGIMCLFALTQSGRVYSWGYNEYAEMGLGYSSDSSVAIVPTKIEGALKDVHVETIVSGSDHVLAISDTGELFGWGYNFFGQCGTGHLEDCVKSPARVKFRGSGTTIVSAAAGMFHSVAVTVEGHVYAWGKNKEHQLGVGTKESYSGLPVRVKFPPAVKVEKVFCGPDCTFAISSRGHLYFWGHCDFNKNAATSPIRVCSNLEEIIDIGAAHWSSVYALQTKTGRVYVWGRLRGQKVVSKSPIENFKARSVSEVFAMFSNPSAMIRPLYPQLPL